MLKLNKEKVEKILMFYIESVNKIDDFLEYNYAGHTNQEVRDIILSELDSLAEKIEGLKDA